MLPGQMQVLLAQERMRTLRAEAAVRRDSHVARAHSRTLRQVRRAECRTARHAEEARRLRAQLTAIEAGTLPA
jgi:hypothetical protein